MHNGHINRHRVLAGAAVALVAGHAAAGLTFYTDRAAFDAALGSQTDISFTGLPTTEIVAGSSTAVGPMSITAGGPAGSVSTARLAGDVLQVQFDGTAGQTLTLGFDRTVRAWGGTFVTPASTSGFTMSFDGETRNLATGAFAQPLLASFFGVISDGDGADSVTWSTNGFETFYVNDFVYGDVPTPGGVLVLAAGLPMVGRRRR